MDTLASYILVLHEEAMHVLYFIETKGKFISFQCYVE